MDYKLIKKIVRDCFRVDRIEWDQVPVLTVAHDNDRSLLHKGKYYSPLIDTMEDELKKQGVRCASVARIISTIKGERAYGAVQSPEGAFARSMVAKRLRGLAAVPQRLFGNLEATPYGANYPYSHSEEKIWGDILDRTGARKAFGIQPSREMCVACHKRGIWVADVQHGVIADTHPWYGESFRGNEPAEWLPTVFLCWDRGSADVINKWSQPKGVSAEVIGNRWLARFARPAPDDLMVQELAQAYRTAVAHKQGKPTILFTLSWGNDNIPNGHVSDGLEAAIRNSSHKYRWILRLHPNQLIGFAAHEGPDFMRYFDKTLAGHAEWEDATRAPLPVVLQDTDLHVSWNSSVCIEAAQMGIRSALFDPRLRDPAVRGDYYTYYRKAGMVELVDESEASVLQWIEANIAAKHTPEAFEASDAAYARLMAFLTGQSAQ